MRISSLAACLAGLVVAACTVRPAIGGDGPPGSFGREEYIRSELRAPLDTPGPEQRGKRFQNVLVITVVPGARCRGSFGTEPRGVDRDREANARREVSLRIETEAGAPKIICLHGGERWERQLPRVAVYARPETATHGGETPWASGAYSYPPIFHMPAVGKAGEARWEIWYESVCPDATDLELREVCASRAELMAADLGDSD